ncbi:MAG: hypothetical protein M1827_003752 [Pycnora praestabilis]|nr:MAG: hypothetical protein M1827_003752 [Pycnora praestabilis]
MSTSTEQLSNFRALTSYITTNDPKDGLAKFHSSIPSTWTRRGPLAAFNTIYTTSEPTPSLADEKDIETHNELVSSGKLGIVNPHGSVFGIVEMGPGNKAPFMHRTSSLDFGVVIEGSIECTLDSGESRVLKVGDSVVQRATKHAWRNTSETEWARMMFLVMDIEKLVVGGKEMGMDLGARADLATKK